MTGNRDKDRLRPQQSMNQDEPHSDEPVLVQPAAPESNNGPCDNTHAAKPMSFLAAHNAIAGGVAGIGARLVTAPLDLWRIRRQLFPQATQSYGLWGGMRHISASEGGIRSLFRGNVAATNLWMGYSAVQFSFYEWASSVLMLHRSTTLSSAEESTTVPIHNISTLPPVVLHFVSGAAAGTVATVATYPLDLTRTVFAAKGIMSHSNNAAAAASTRNNTPVLFTGGGSYTPRSIYEFVTHVWHRQGPRGLFAGCGPAVVQIIPYMGLNFCIHDWLVSTMARPQSPETSILLEQDQSSTVSASVSGIAGGVSGATSKIIVFPLDTIKKRLQAQTAFGVVYKNMMDCFLTIIRNEGGRSLYNGLVPTVLKNTVATALSFGLFTRTKNFLATLE